MIVTIPDIPNILYFDKLINFFSSLFTNYEGIMIAISVLLSLGAVSIMLSVVGKVILKGL